MEFVPWASAVEVAVGPAVYVVVAAAVAVAVVVASDVVACVPGDDGWCW